MIRNRKSIYVGLVIILLVSVTIGYALINSTLNINGRSNISKNSWDIHFDNIVVKDGSVEAVKIPNIENSTTLDFEVVLNLPGDFYEFIVDVVNNGTIDAMIDGFNKTPDLTANQLKYLNYIIEYENGEEVASKQLVKAGEFVRLKVRVEYKRDINSSDLPQSTETLNLGFTVNHIQSDGSGSGVTDNGVYDPYKIGNEICFDTECFYVISRTDETVTMLAKYNLYVGNTCTSTDSRTCISYGDEATGKQDSNMLGYVSEQTIRKGTLAFSNVNYWESTSYPVYVYNENSALYNYVENYKTYLSMLGVIPSEARLITYEELTSLGCSALSCSSAPSWVYATSYWTGAAVTSVNVRYVNSDGIFGGNSCSVSGDFGCRPVIVIPKSYITGTTNKNIVNLIIDDVTYQVEEGMTWREWINSSYNLNNRFIFDEYGYVYNISNNRPLNQCVKSADVINKNIIYDSSDLVSVACNVLTEDDFS